MKDQPETLRTLLWKFVDFLHKIYDQILDTKNRILDTKVDDIVPFTVGIIFCTIIYMISRKLEKPVYSFIQGTNNASESFWNQKMSMWQRAWLCLVILHSGIVFMLIIIGAPNLKRIYHYILLWIVPLAVFYLFAIVANWLYPTDKFQ